MKKKSFSVRIIEYLKELDISAELMSKADLKEFKNSFVNSFTDDEKIKVVSLPDENHRYHNYLWHVFSYDEGKAIEGEKAAVEYDIINKKDAYIYIDDNDLLFLAQNVSLLSAEEIEKLCVNMKRKFMDIVVVSKDFSWTYCRTHEVDWLGPYFYKK